MQGRKSFAAPLRAPHRAAKPAAPPRASPRAPVPAPAAAAAGNLETLRAFGVRPALAVSSPSDPEERDADLAAAAFAARAPLPVGFGTRGVLADIRRKCSSCEEERIARKADGSNALGATTQTLPTARGEPLTPQVRAPYERFFHADLSAVRIHTGN